MLVAGEENEVAYGSTVDVLRGLFGVSDHGCPLVQMRIARGKARGAAFAPAPGAKHLVAYRKPALLLYGLDAVVVSTSGLQS